MTFVLEGGNLLFFGVCFLLALFISMSEFSAPDVSLGTKQCPKHPGVAKCVCRGDDFGGRKRP